MKISCKVTLLVLLILFCTSLSALTQQVRIRCSDESLSKIMVALRDTGKLMVSFDDRLLSTYTVTIDRQFESVPQALDYILNDLPLVYEISDGVYVIYPVLTKEMTEIIPVREMTSNREKAPFSEKELDEFNKAAESRKQEAIARMIDIRKAQRVYKDQKSAYTDSFDTLINFLKNDSIRVIKAIGVIPVSLVDSVKDIRKAREIAFERGLIQGTSSKVAVIDSVFGRRKNVVDSLRFVPFADGSNFTMKAGEHVIQGGQPSKFLEVSVPFDKLLKGLESQLIEKYIDNWMKIKKFPGLKFGSLEAVTLAGNWE